MAEVLTEREKLQKTIEDAQARMALAAEKAKDKIEKIDEKNVKALKAIENWKNLIAKKTEKINEDLVLRDKYVREVLAEQPEAVIPESPVA